MLTAEQLIAAQKAQMETLFGLTTKAFEGIEKLVELNVVASKAALAEASEHAQTVMGAKDPSQAAATHMAALQSAGEKTVAYIRHLTEISSGAGADLGKAFEAQTTDAQKKFMAVIDGAAKNAPAGSETAVAVMKSSVAAANNAFESIQKAVKQATEMAEANFNTATATAVAATKTATKKR